jgi:dephospho-CoA kinase
MARVIGLTGGLGTGKTFVASVFRSLGAKVIDADLAARSEIRKGSACYRKVVSAFGPRILRRSGEIDRRSLADIVFSDRRALKRLERIVHPPVIKAIESQIVRSRARDVLVIDAPLLMEAGLAKRADMVVVVHASKRTQLARLSKERSMKRSDALKRISAQMPMNRKIGAADRVIYNDGTKSQTRRQVKELWKEIVWR